ncbi:tRNA (adenosine(37)-N6)-threonylcarbamoyltransferase complex ATPase subunit type 1 TsaE [bacterium]|nr:tRNA (adenosine(37)-N6)-threonylcarbamoyltransferase complex ATPase subunit type 1 TsaE [bacterium]
MTITTHSAEKTKRVAADLAKTLRGGEVIALEGELGAGKTTFTQGLCEALGVTDTVTSPTFAIMNVYQGRFRVVHLDVYRLKSTREIAMLGLEDYLGAKDTVTLIEWPGAVDGVEWKPNATVRLASLSATDRTIEIDYGNGGRAVSTDDGDDGGTDALA